MTTPQNLINQEAELAVLGIMLLQPDLQYHLESLETKHFYSCQKMFEAIKQAYLKHGKAEMLNIDWNRDEIFLTYSKASLGSIESALSLLYECYIAREAYYLAVSVTEYTQNYQEGKDTAKKLEELIEGYNQKVDLQAYNLQSIDKVLEGYINYKATKWYKDRTTDFVFGGDLRGYTMSPGHLCSVVARTKAGKTTLLSQLALQALEQNRPVLFVSLEVDNNQIIDKMTAYKANLNPLATINYQNPKNYSKTQDEVVSETLGWFQNKPLNFYHTPDCSLGDLRMKIKEFSKTNPQGVIFIDQLQFISTDQRFESRIYQYDFIMRKIKQFALEFNCVVFLAHQLNRNIEMRENKYPQTSDIKDSGRIEEISDLLILFAQSKNPDTRNCTIISRHMAGGYYELHWDKTKARFTNI